MNCDRNSYDDDDNDDEDANDISDTISNKVWNK